MLNSDIYYVIGSGPAGIACAYGLLERGKRVVILDHGKEVEPASMERYARNFNAQSIAEEDLQYFRRPAPRLTGGAPLKLKYGSAFCYDTESLELDHAAVCGSLAQGGLSNVWGAASLPFREHELASWPIHFKDLEQGYCKVQNLFQLMAVEDGLKADFPLYAEQYGSLDPSAQAKYVYQRMQKNQTLLNHQGVQFGHSRLAFNRNGAHPDGCIYCGLCFYGCFKNQIFCSSDCLVQLQKYPDFEYRPGLYIERFSESEEGVVIYAKDLHSNEAIVLTGYALFIGAGVLNTAKIVAKSVANFHTFRALDTQYFLIPALLFKAFKGAQLKENFTLAQLFLELALPELQEYIHLQLYTHNEVIEAELKGKLKSLPGHRLLSRFLMQRMLVIQGFLPSSSSGYIDIHVEGDSVQLHGVTNSESIKLINKIKKILLKNAKNFGFLPLTLATDMSLPGRSFHIGGLWKTMAFG